MRLPLGYNGSLNVLQNIECFGCGAKTTCRTKSGWWGSLKNLCFGQQVRTYSVVEERPSRILVIFRASKFCVLELTISHLQVTPVNRVKRDIYCLTGAC